MTYEDIKNGKFTYIKRIIENNSYQGILLQDGWETLELTVRNKHSKIISDLIIDYLDLVTQ